MQELFDLFYDAVDLDREMGDLEEFLRSDRPTTFAAWSRTAELIEGKLAACGCDLVNIYDFEALGKDPYGDWPPIRSWDLATSELWLLDENDRPVEKLTSYPENFCATMMYSASTPPEGVTAEVVAFDTERPDNVAGKVAFWPVGQGKLDAGLAGRAGAVGLIHDFNYELNRNPDRFEEAKDLSCWDNATLLYHPFSELWGFSITPAQGRRLGEMLGRGKVRVRAMVDSAFDRHPLRHVRGVLAGESLDERVVLIAHAFEQGANDNAVGVAAVIEAVRLVKQMIAAGRLAKPPRSIDVQLSNEVLSTLAFYESASRGRVDNWPRRHACGLNLDSCGFASRQGAMPMTYSSVLPGAAPYGGDLMLQLLNCAKAREPWFAWSQKSMSNDRLMISDPMLGAPTTLLGHQHHATYHTNGDNIDDLDRPTIKLVTAVTAAFAYAAACADASDVYRPADAAPMPEEFAARDELRRIPKRLVWGPLFLSARKLPEPFNGWFGWSSRGLIPLYLMDGRRSLGEVLHQAGVTAENLDEYVAFAEALAEAEIIKLE